jgi:hypothetical protein
MSVRRVAPISVTDSSGRKRWIQLASLAEIGRSDSDAADVGNTCGQKELWRLNRGSRGVLAQTRIRRVQSDDGVPGIRPLASDREACDVARVQRARRR